jgi:hypothetical protein
MAKAEAMEGTSTGKFASKSGVITTTLINHGLAEPSISVDVCHIDYIHFVNVTEILPSLPRDSMEAELNFSPRSPTTELLYHRVELTARARTKQSVQMAALHGRR